MNEMQATKIAEILGGPAWQSGGDIWLVLFERSDGKVVALSDDVVCEYADQFALEDGNQSASIILH